MDAAHLEDTRSQQSRDDACNVQCGPESGQTNSQLLGLVEVGREQDHTRNETSFASTDQSAGDVERGAVVHPGLRPRDGSPHEHHGGQDVLESISFGQELNRELSCHETDELDGGSVVIIVGGEAEVVEQVVGQGIAQVASVKLQTEHHDAEP